MSKPPIPMPTTDVLPPGPTRDLLAKIHDLYGVSGKSLAALNRRSQSYSESPVILSKQRLSDMLHGVSEPLSQWPYIKALVEVLTYDLPPATVQAAQEEVHRLWVAHIEHQQTFETGSSDEARLSPSSHFARLSYSQWCLEAELSRRRPPPRYLQGSFAVMASEFDINTTGRGVYDASLQNNLCGFVEWSALRGGIRVFQTRLDRRPTSFVISGLLVPQHSKRTPQAFIAIEVHDRGVATVFFREEATNATLEEALAWWIHGSTEAAAYAHTRLGSRGPSEASLVLDRLGLAEVEQPQREMTDEPLGALRYGELSNRYLQNNFSTPPLEAALTNHMAAQSFAGEWASQTTDQISRTLQPKSEPQQWAITYHRLRETFAVRR